jgi:hypothetical protein
LNAAPHARFRVVLLGVDLWWLNDRRDISSHLAEGIRHDAAHSWENHLLAMRLCSWRDWELLVSPLPDRIGLAAQQTNGGFRSDGSFRSGLPAPTSAKGWRFVDREVPPIGERITRGVNQFVPTSGISFPRLQLLRNHLLRFRERGTLVVGYAPPFSSEAAHLMESVPTQQRIWTEYHTWLPRVFRELGLPFVDATNPASLGMDDRCMVDGFHAEETFQLYLLQRMLADRAVRRALPTASAAIEKALHAPGTNYWYADFGGPA